ncbi:MAG TPA: hypothetical protein VMO17_10395, partial [Terriglobia bacterium]|nr:hypothetical protein [Terriglobia bacterium]
MNGTSGKKFDIREEFRVVPKAMVAVAVLLFLAMQVVLLAVLFRRDAHPPPVVLQVPIAFLGGSVLAFFALLIGYINRDAKRRGMNPALWTLLAIFLPYGIGIIIYFLMRE